MNRTASSARTPWLWIPTAYFTQGLPYVMVMSVATLMYKRMGAADGDIAFYTSWLYLPWVLKPFWSPLVEILRTRRAWAIAAQLLTGAGLAGVALALPGPDYFRYSLLFLWLAAFSSATYDISIDGYYLLVLREDQQAFFVGIRSTFYRLAMITGQGGLVILAGLLTERFGTRAGWAMTFGTAAGIILAAGLYHLFLLPRPAADQARQETLASSFRALLQMIVSFFQKPAILPVLLFLLFFRLGEGQLLKINNLFFAETRENGGLGLHTAEIGLIYGTLGVMAVMGGGIVGGILISRDGLKRWLWWMVAALNLPNAGYIYLAYAQPESLWISGAFVVFEQLGYGFGFSAFMAYLLYLSEGPFRTAHYAFATGIMALGMMVPGMLSGYLKEALGYPIFFTAVLLSCLVPAFITAFVPLNPEFGKKRQ